MKVCSFAVDVQGDAELSRDLMQAAFVVLQMRMRRPFYIGIWSSGPQACPRDCYKIVHFELGQTAAGRVCTTTWKSDRLWSEEQPLTMAWT